MSSYLENIMRKKNRKSLKKLFIEKTATAAEYGYAKTCKKIVSVLTIKTPNDIYYQSKKFVRTEQRLTFPK